MPRKKFSSPKTQTKKIARVKSGFQRKDSLKTADTKSAPKKNSADKSKVIALLRGMKDILPPNSADFLQVRGIAESIASAYGFGYIETPILEQASLFIRSLGKATDVVNKEMYVFEDKDGARICLRPENTVAITRAFISHGMQNMPQPVKVWYWGSMFRHDRPQAGRYREFHQFGAETLGERGPVVDAELIALAYHFLKDVGIESTVEVNSIGTLEDRQQYCIELIGYLRSKRSYLSEESKKRMVRNPLRVLDSKEEQDRAVVEEAPQIVDWLSDESKKFFMQVLEYLDELAIPYVLKPTLVRGLDYYTDTVFELYEEGAEVASQNALGGGGRYDKLVEYLGGPTTSAAGFSIGIERVLAVLQAKKSHDSLAVQKKQGGFFLAQLGEQAKKQALGLMEGLRKAGITVAHNFAKSSLKAQLETANKLGVTHTLILGQKEVQDGTILVRNMDSGIQEIVDQKKLKASLQKLMD